MALAKKFSIKLKPIKFAAFYEEGLLNPLLQKPIYLTKKFSFNYAMYVRTCYYNFLNGVKNYKGPNIPLHQYIAQYKPYITYKMNYTLFINILKFHIFSLLVYKDDNLETMTYELIGLIKYTDVSYFDRKIFNIAGSCQHFTDSFTGDLNNTVIYKNTPITKMEKDNHNSWNLFTDENKFQNYDIIIFAIKPNKLNDLLKNSNAKERKIIANIKSKECHLICHTDHSILNLEQEKWESYMFVTKNNVLLPTAWIGRSENLNFFHTYCTDPSNVKLIDKDKICYRSVVHHPICDHHMYKARFEIETIQGKNGLYFAGHWVQNGSAFMEGAIDSAITISKLIDPQSARLSWLIIEANKVAKVTKPRQAKLLIIGSLLFLLNKLLHFIFKSYNKL